MWFLLLIIINLILIKSQETLKIEKTNALKDKNNYNCILPIKEIKKSKEDIKYVVFDFPKEKKNKRNEVYISPKEKEASNSGTIYKLPLFGSNKIIIPYDYIKSEDNLYVNIICFKNEKCNEEIIINIYSKIAIKEGETLYINGYKENYIYNFEYIYNNKNIKENIYKQISVYSYQKNDFEINLNKKKNNINMDHILNGYLYNIKKNEHKDCNKDCDFQLELKIKKPSAYIMIQIISIDNDKDYNDIELIRPIIGILKDENEKKCFYIKEKNDEEYFIDFMIEDESHSLIFEYNNESKNILFSQTIKYKSSEGKFCLKKLYPKVNFISFSFTVYIPDTDDYFSLNDPHSFIRTKSFLGLLYNGYFYRKIIKESNVKNSYFPSEYNGNILYFYLYILRGIVDVSNLITNNFPFNKNENNEKEFFKLININNIGNEYFGTILIKNQNEMNSSPMDANKNIFLVKCVSGIGFNDEESNYCEYNIIFYTENDLIHLRINEKFSYLNYEKMKLKMKINQKVEKNKLIVDLYTHFGFSYVNILNKDKNSSLNTFYNGNLINNEIIFNNDNNIELDIFDLEFEVISYDYDYVSILINGNIDNNNKDLLETRFWFNDNIMTTLSKRIPKKKIIIDHIPRAITDYNYFKTIFFIKYLNCEVNTNILDNISKERHFLSGFQDIIDNNHLIIIENDLSESKNKIQLEIELKKLYNDEPVCMIYFTTFLIEDIGLTTLYPILIKENTDTPIILTSKYNYIVNFEYIILNYNAPIIISISFEEITKIHLCYRINDNKIKSINIFFSQNIIISEKEIKDKCSNEENKLCVLKIEVGKQGQTIYDSEFLSKKVLLNINIKSNYEKHVSYLIPNYLKDGIILGDQFQYYYTNIRQNDSGSIVLNNKKGIGLMYAKIINKNSIDEIKDWNGRIHLINRDELENCDDCLIYDINTNIINFSEKDTQNCISDLRCQIIIGIANIENKNEDNNNENDVYEYSIYFLKNNIPKQIYGNIKIQSNKYIQGTLYNNNQNNKIIFDYFIPENVEIIKYELQCKYCSLYLITNNSRIKQDYEEKDNNIDKYGSKIIKFEREEEIQLYYNKIISFEILIDKKEKEKLCNFYFKISLIFKGMQKHILLLNSEMNSICYNECFYLIPIYNYDKLTSLVMSISDNNLKAKVNAKLSFVIYDSIDYYDYIMFEDNKYTKNPDLIGKTPKYNRIISRKNYIIFEANNTYENMLIIGYIKIYNEVNNNNNNEAYPVYFTYSKNSRKNYFLYPNRNNLLYINKNSETKNVKEIRIPDYYLIKNNKNNNNNHKDSSIIIFSHIKGEGVVELVTNNYYLHNNEIKLYSELKSFIFDNFHSFFQINYNQKSKFSKKFFINSESGLYTYSKISTNLYPNINEIKLGKTNNILHQYDSSTIYLYMIINNINEIENDITIDIKIEGLEIYKIYNISITGYFSYSKNLDIDFNNNKKYAISKGFYDNITNIGIIKFKSKSMKMYYTEKNINLLVINILDMNYNKNESIDVLIKATPIPNQLLLKDNFDVINDNYEYSIPQFEHYFSFIDLSVNNSMIYKLNINSDHNYISIELLFLYNETSFCFHIDKSNLSPDNPKFYYNDTNLNVIKFIDERYKNGKRSIILKIEKIISEIYLIIFINNQNENIDKAFFSLKYYSFNDKDYLEGKYLYKNRFYVNNSNVMIRKNNNDNYVLNWEKIELVKLKNEKGEIKIDYYIKLINENENDIYNYNNGLFNNYLNNKNIYGIHLINKNEYEINKIIKNIININNIEIYVIAKFNEINGMENFFVYQPLILKTNDIINNDNNNDNTINDNYKNEDNNNNDNNMKKKMHIFLKIFIFILIIFLIILIILYLFKLIRMMQIKALYDKYINKDNKKISLFNEEKYNNDSFESKISFLIEK